MESPGAASSPPPRRVIAAGALLVALAALATYAPALGLGFDEIDDSLHLQGARDGYYASPHFRPLHRAWNVVLLRIFGLNPLPWHLAGLALHVCGAWLVGFLAWRIRGRAAAGLAAALAFATLAAPHEVVIWIAAHTSTLAVFLVLLAAAAFAEFIRTARTRWWTASVLATLFAALAKEECVVLAVLLPAIDLSMRGTAGAMRWPRLKAYLPYALIGSAYLAVALRPELWSGDAAGGAAYAIRPAIVPRVLRSFGWLFVPRAPVAGASQAIVWITAIAVLAAVTLAAVRFRAARGLLLVGLATALAGFLPTAPGPFEILQGRYAYASSIGAALLVGAAFDIAWERFRAAPARAFAATLLLAWIGLHARAVHSVVSWRFAPRAARLDNLMRTTRDLVLAPLGEPGGPHTVVIAAPQIWNDADYVAALGVFLGLDRSRFEVDHVPPEDVFRADGTPVAGLDPARDVVLTSYANGTLHRLADATEIPRADWAARAAHRKAIGLDRSITILRFGPPRGR